MKSKSRWSNANGCSATSAFFVSAVQEFGIGGNHCSWTIGVAHTTGPELGDRTLWMTNGQRQQDRPRAGTRKDDEDQQRQGDQERRRQEGAARKAYRAKIESLLDESRDERLADVWQRVCPFPIDPAYELPDRRGIIEDLADFAEAIQPSLDGMKADRLCRLIEKYAAGVGTMTFSWTAA